MQRRLDSLPRLTRRDLRSIHEAAGRVREMQGAQAVLSGEINAASIASELEQALTSLDALLRTHGVADEEEACRANVHYEDALGSVDEAQRIFKEALDGRTFEEIEASTGHGIDCLTDSGPLLDRQ